MRLWFTGVKIKSTGATYPYNKGDTNGILYMVTDTLGSLAISIECGLEKLALLAKHLRADSDCVKFSDDYVLESIDLSEPLEFVNFELLEYFGRYALAPKYDYQFKGEPISEVVDRFNAKATGLMFNLRMELDDFGVKVTKLAETQCGDIAETLCSAPYINSLGTHLFKNSSITKFKCGTNLIAIDGYCFDGSDLREVQFNDNLICLYNSAFRTCNNLTKLVLPKSLRVLDTCSILFCKELRYLELNPGIRFIGSSALEYCGSLRELKINMTDCCAFSRSAFDECDLRKVVLARGMANNERIESIISKIRSRSSGRVEIILF